MNEISNDPVEGIDAAPVRLGMGVAGGRYGDTAWHGVATVEGGRPRQLVTAA
jgi:hypothetical protein